MRVQIADLTFALTVFIWRILEVTGKWLNKVQMFCVSVQMHSIILYKAHANKCGKHTQKKSHKTIKNMTRINKKKKKEKKGTNKKGTTYKFQAHFIL